MRALRRSFVLLAPLTIAITGVFACEEDSPPGAEFNFPEAGGVDTNQPPLPGTDSSTKPDAPGDVVPKPTTVTVTITDRLGPKANITVVFHDASGAVTETRTTGNDGK